MWKLLLCQECPGSSTAGAHTVERTCKDLSCLAARRDRRGEPWQGIRHRTERGACCMKAFESRRTDGAAPCELRQRRREKQTDRKPAPGTEQHAEGPLPPALLALLPSHPGSPGAGSISGGNLTVTRETITPLNLWGLPRRQSWASEG